MVYFRSNRVVGMVCFCLFLCVGSFAQGGNPTLDAIRVSDYYDYSHVCIELGSMDQYTVRTALTPVPHVEVRFRDISASGYGSSYTVKSDVVGNISISRDPTGRWLILRIPVSKSVDLSKFQYHAWKDFLTIDLPLKTPNSKVYPSPAEIENFKRRGGRVVVIDPGHGGFHSGTTGGSYTRVPRQEEKTIVLDMAYRIKKLMDQNPQIMCLLTRTDDYLPVPFGFKGTSRQTYVSESLIYRVQLAQELKGDLYISLHLNATVGSSQKTARGYEIYYMGDENANSLYNSHNMDLQQLEALGINKKDDSSNLISAIKRDIVPQNSKLLAHAITDQMRTVSGLQFRPNTIVSNKNLRVIKHFNMPSVLVEFLFLTHPEEHEYIRSSRNRDSLCKALYNGVLDYLKISNSQGTTPRSAIPQVAMNPDRSGDFKASSTRVIPPASVNTRESVREYPLSQEKRYSLADQIRELESRQERLEQRTVLDPDALVVLTELDLEKGATGDLGKQAVAQLEQLTHKAVDTTQDKKFTLPAKPEPIEHKVKRGETLGIIAQSYGVTLQEIRELNRGGIGRGDRIQLNQVIKIPGDAKAEPLPKKETPALLTYEVRKGDSLESIASRFGTTPLALKEMNNLKSSLIHPGDKIQISISSAKKVAEAKKEPPKPITHEVKKGDTLGKIADQYKVPLKTLQQANQIKNSHISVGQVLQIPN